MRATVCPEWTPLVRSGGGVLTGGTSRCPVHIAVEFTQHTARVFGGGPPGLEEVGFNLKRGPLVCAC